VHPPHRSRQVIVDVTNPNPHDVERMTMRKSVIGAGWGARTGPASDLETCKDVDVTPGKCCTALAWHGR